MMDFDVARCTRRCAGSNRELQPGELFYSTLVPDGNDVKRLDFSVKAWEGPPENALCTWKSRMPEPASQRAKLAPTEVLFQYFEHLEDQPERADVRFVLALLLVRRRLLNLQTTETDELGREVWVTVSPETDTEHRVLAQTPPDERIDQIQEELSQMLYADTE